MARLRMVIAAKKAADESVSVAGIESGFLVISPLSQDAQETISPN